MLCERVSGEPHTLVATSAHPPTPTPLYPIIRTDPARCGSDETDNACSQLDKLEASLRLAFDDVPRCGPLSQASFR